MWRRRNKNGEIQKKLTSCLTALAYNDHETPHGAGLLKHQLPKGRKQIMEILDQDGIHILTHGPHGIEFTLDELEAMRGLSSAELRTWLRENKYPQLPPKRQGALTAIVNDIDQLPAAVERFFRERENSDDSVTVESAG
jgi:hypothetical protein